MKSAVETAIAEYTSCFAKPRSPLPEHSCCCGGGPRPPRSFEGRNARTSQSLFLPFVALLQQLPLFVAAKTRLRRHFWSDKINLAAVVFAAILKTCKHFEDAHYFVIIFFIIHCCCKHWTKFSRCRVDSVIAAKLPPVLAIANGKVVKAKTDFAAVLSVFAATQTCTTDCQRRD